jgi:hypothetical protein
MIDRETRQMLVGFTALFGLALAYVIYRNLIT